MDHGATARGSARTEADRAAAAASKLDRKAAYARRRAANFQQGADGELATARTLAELTVEGWHVLHDRLLPHGGNIDHLAIGPAGVFVVDAKAWAHPATIDSTGRVRAGRYDKQQDVDRLRAAAATVEAALRATGHNAPVTPVLVLTGPGQTIDHSELPDGTVVLGLSHLVAELRSYPAPAGQALVDALTAPVATAFPASTNHSDTPADEPVAPVAPVAPANRLFLRANIFLFVEPWARAGRRRLYLNDEHGSTLGYKELATDEVTTENEETAELARSVLQRAHPAGLGLVLDELPRISIDIPAGRLLGTLGRLWRSFLIAQHWRGHGKDRLYVTHVLPGQGIFDLGHIDLRNRTLHPSSTQPLAKDLRTPQRYLELTLERYPRP